MRHAHQQLPWVLLAQAIRVHRVIHRDCGSRSSLRQSCSISPRQCKGVAVARMCTNEEQGAHRHHIAQVGDMRAAHGPTCDAWLIRIAGINASQVSSRCCTRPAAGSIWCSALWRSRQAAQAHLKESSPRPNQLLPDRSAPTLWWLSLAADVMMATGVVCWPPYSLWCRYSRAWHQQQRMHESKIIYPHEALRSRSEVCHRECIKGTAQHGGC